MNRVELIGRISTDINFRFTPAKGTAVANFNVAVTDYHTKTEDGKYGVDFIRVVVFGKTAETVAEKMKKGRNIGVSGRINTRNYEDKEGNKKYITQVIADNLHFIDWGGNKKSDNEPDYGPDVTPVDDEDIPF